ncbi:TetR family transcriptional regulator [Nocardioides cavernaquae]|uniref:TetR family transcriptional regulator n=1 Tax=Nocardioides cavernaquae TaxID=2321396 RepID=A0A3A5HFQ7_9ACTN|nr:TetR family transcriptional regulator [Nocardioides cavernaquae]RJS46874.1 TetR family transcriptional regulator [Nocardioides cavernaquae]
MSSPGVSRTEQKERTRRAILDAALSLAEEGGLAAISLRQIAKEIGIVPTAFYRHFAGIEELGLTLVEESFDALRAMLRDAREVRGPIADDRELFLAVVDRSLEALVTHARHSDRHLRFISRERIAGPTVIRDAVRHQLQLVESELAADIGRVPGVTRWSSEDLLVLADLIVNAMLAQAEELARAGGRTDEVRQIAARARRQLHMVLIGALRWDSSR